MKIITATFFSFFTLNIFSQDTLFFDIDWNELKGKPNYEYYKVIEKDKSDSSKASERTYFKSGQIKEENFYINYSKEIKEGVCKSWYDNGQLRREINYLNGEYTGKLLTYWKNGQLKRNDIYDNGKLIEGHLKNSDGVDTPFYDYVIMPVYPGGTNELVRFIGKETRYPKKAKKNGIHGKVIVKFVVSTTGEITNAVVVKSVSKDLDAEALRVVNNMPKWEPGMLDGEKVPVYFNLPINFSITGN